jgi:hypothetical protein
MTEPIHQALAERAMVPGEHYLDSGYPSADLLVSSLTDYGIRLVTPMLADTSPQARAADVAFLRLRCGWVSLAGQSARQLSAASTRSDR